jgi:hypothetical protein
MAHTDQLDYVWWVERDSIAISKYDGSLGIDDRFSGPPAGKTVTLFVVKYDEDFIRADSGNGIGMEESPAMPEEFHEAIVNKAIQKGFELKIGEDPRLFNVAAYWRAGFEKMVKEGIQYSNEERVGSGKYFIKQHDF